MSASSVADVLLGGEPCLDSKPIEPPAPVVRSEPGNACTWRPRMITLADGQQVPSDSPLWASECEARAVWGMTDDKREAFFEAVGRRRGELALKALKDRIAELEPHFVLGLPSREQRRAYAAKVETRFGPLTRERLEARVRKLWELRKGAA